jgi:chemotaxis family two-component system response regulator Rcp1
MIVNDAAMINILLVEDNVADVRLTQEAMRESKLINRLDVTSDGVAALQYLRKEGEYKEAERPDLILLDLNLPRKDGRELLEEIKKDEYLKSIPVVVLTTSESELDILKSYNLHANCYITKPVELDKFLTIVQYIEQFWFTIVKLPSLKKESLLTTKKNQTSSS